MSLPFHRLHNIPILRYVVVLLSIVLLEHRHLLPSNRCSTTIRYVVNALPSGFIDEGVVARNAIITSTFAPNPRNNGKPMLLLSSKKGNVYALEDPDNSDEDMTILEVPENFMCTNGERGLQSVMVHPDFMNNQYIYMYFSSYVDDCPESDKTGPPNHLSRFTMNKDTLQIDIDSEVIILETSPAPKFMHNGGSMAFGNDGYIYLTIGDGGSREPAYSQDLRILYGSVIRIDDDGIAPRSNPYTIESGGTGVPCAKSGGVPPKDAPDDAVCEEIYASGLRNPFRFAMNMNVVDKVEFRIGDVGASHWEEISMGGTDYIGANYGWPIQEGPCKIGSTTDCGVDEDKYIDPIYYYEHKALAEGGCITGATYVPNGIWPEQYKYLFIDFIFGTVYNLIEDPDRECRACTPPIPAYRNETFYTREIMIDLFFGPYKDTKALYVISRDEGQSIRRIRYTGNSNRAPVSVIQVSSTTASVNEKLSFDGSDSSDADDDTITYLWDFGDGTISTEINPDHTYKDLGEYTVTLTVTDTEEQTNQNYVVVVVGEPPTIVMESPLQGIQFSVGEEIRVKGTAMDAQQQTLSNQQISWEVKQHHGDHFHPFLERKYGNDFLLDPAPAPEDFSAATNSYLEVIMYATDNNGITSSISRIVQPKKRLVAIDSQPRGLVVTVDEFSVTTPTNITSWVHHKLRLNVQEEQQGKYKFDSWSVDNGSGDMKISYTIPPNNGTTKNVPFVLAKFVSTTTGNEPVNASNNSTTTTTTTSPTLTPTTIKKFVPVTTKTPTRTPMAVFTSAPINVASVSDDTPSPVPTLFPSPTTIPSLIPIATTDTPVKDDVGNDEDNQNENDEDTDDSEKDDDNDEMEMELVALIPITRKCSIDDPCERCEGDCNTDDDCMDGLVCYNKNRGDINNDHVVPGCYGIDTSRTDWCTTKEAIAMTTTESI